MVVDSTTGRATVLGLVPWHQRQDLSRRIGTLFGQRSQLWQELPPRTSFRMLGAIFGLDDSYTDRRVAELGELLDATDLFDRPVRGLSLGQRMRCELSAVMLHEPELLFLDEPTIGLDLLGKQLFRRLLIRLNEELQTTVFLTSHDVADIEHVADRAIVVNHGSIIYDASVASMRRELLGTKRIEIGLEGAVEPGFVEAFAGPDATVHAASASAMVIDVDTTSTPIRTVLDRVLAELPVADLSVVDPPLEQVIGEIPIDAIFSPVQRVRYRVEDARIGQRTDYDKLIMDIWTDATISPELALVESAKILRKHLNPFVQYFDLGADRAREPVLGTGALVVAVGADG